MNDIGWMCKICGMKVTPNDVFLHYAKHHRLMTTYAAPVYITEALVPIVEEPTKAPKVRRTRKKPKPEPVPEPVEEPEETEEEELDEEEDIETEDLSIEEDE